MQWHRTECIFTQSSSVFVSQSPSEFMSSHQDDNNCKLRADSAQWWSVQSAHNLYSMREGFSPVNNFSFLMDLLLSIISYQLTQQGAAFQSSDDNNCHLELHHPGLDWCNQPSHLWEHRAPPLVSGKVYLRCLHFWCCTLPVFQSVRVHKTTQILCLYSSSTPSQPGLSSALMITNHHPASQPASQALHCLSLNILNSPGPGFPVPTSWWLCEVWPPLCPLSSLPPINKDNLGLSYAITVC